MNELIHAFRAVLTYKNSESLFTIVIIISTILLFHTYESYVTNYSLQTLVSQLTNISQMPILYKPL